jgi:tRNA1(Val) A37 N6-methylase TrmN6
MSSDNITIKDYFKKFHGMSPYLTIQKEEWDWIKKTWEKEEIVETLADVLFTYPYPFPEMTSDEVLDDYKKLKGTWWPDILVEGQWFPRNDNNSKYDLTFGNKPMFFKRINTGNKASNIFHIETRHKVDWVRMPSPWKTWQTPKGIQTVVRAFFTLEENLDMVNKRNIMLAIQMRKYVPAQFKPVIAKAFYDYFKSENILDFSAGWGDRLCGFFASEYGKKYVGIDPNKSNTDGYKKQIDFYKKNKTFFENEKDAEMIESPAEDVNYSRFENFFDTVFTSPPYFNTEKYSYDDTQSWVRYKAIDDWNKNFLHKTLGKIIPTIKRNGILAINISDVYSSPEKGYVPIVNPMNDFLVNEGLKYEGCIGMEMAKRMNSAGAGKASSDYFSEELRERTEEKKNQAFGEPIWVFSKPF